MSVTLDGIRALAAQAVVVGHAISFFHILPALQPPRAPFMQNVGVVVFFVLSGYLIAYTVWRKRAKGRYSFRTYGIERFARIFSGFVPGLIFIAAVDTGVLLLGSSKYIYSSEYSVGNFVANLAMLQDHAFTAWVGGFMPRDIAPWVAGVTTFGSGRPLWTLAIEWWIYMAFGWLVLSGATRTRHPVRFLATAVLVSALPVFNLVGGRGDSLTLMWIAGALTFWVSMTTRPRWSGRTSLVLSFLLAVAAAYRVRLTGHEYDLAFACLLAGALYFLMATLRTTSFRYPAPVIRAARFFAGYSLTLYLIHYTILATLFAADLPLPKPLVVVGGIVLCNVCAALIAWPTEMQHKRFAAWLLARVPGSTRSVPADGRPYLPPALAEQGWTEQ